MKTTQEESARSSCVWKSATQNDEWNFAKKKKRFFPCASKNSEKSKTSWAAATRTREEKHERKICCVFIIIIERKTRLGRLFALRQHDQRGYSWFFDSTHGRFSVLLCVQQEEQLGELRRDIVENSTHERWLTDETIRAKQFTRWLASCLYRCRFCQVNLTFKVCSLSDDRWWWWRADSGKLFRFPEIRFGRCWWWICPAITLPWLFRRISSERKKEDR